MIYVSLDPGEVWTGLAVLRNLGDRSWRGDIAVLNGRSNYLRPVYVIEKLFEIRDKREFMSIIAEEYQVRPVGHQRFTMARTARLLGALEFICQRENVPWSTIPANSPTPNLLRALGLSRIFNTWKPSWKNRSDARWAHGVSAWRILATYLMQQDEPLTISRGFTNITKKGFLEPLIQNEELVAPPIFLTMEIP